MHDPIRLGKRQAILVLTERTAQDLHTAHPHQPGDIRKRHRPPRHQTREHPGEPRGLLYKDHRLRIGS